MAASYGPQNWLQGLGLTITPADKNIDKARDYYLGTYDTKGAPAGTYGLAGALAEGREMRGEYLDRFGEERDRILGQYDEAREGYRPFNEAATIGMEDMATAATPEGYLERINALSNDPGFQQVLARQQERRMRAAEATMAAGGNIRGGAAAHAAADATLTPEELAFQVEPTLYGRSRDMASMYRDLPIAPQMVADTYRYDVANINNLVQQGMTRGQAELLKGQVANQATNNLLGLLEDLLSRGPITGGNDPIGDIIGEVGEILDDFGGTIGGWGEEFYKEIKDIFDDIGFDGQVGPGGTGKDEGGFGTPPIMPIPGGEGPIGGPVEDTDPNWGGYDDVQRPDMPPEGGPGQGEPVVQPQPVPVPPGMEVPQLPAPETPPWPPVDEVLEEAIVAPIPELDPDIPKLPDIGPDGPDFEVSPGDVFEYDTGELINSFVGGGKGSIPIGINTTGILSQLAGFGGLKLGEMLFGKTGSGWGTNAGTVLGSLTPLGPIGGALIGGMIDSAFGTSDKKNVTMGVASTKPGDDVTHEITTPSGLKLWGIGRRVPGSATGDYLDTIVAIDEFMLDQAKNAGFDIKLRNNGFGGEVKGKGKNLKKNPTFFGSATEGSGETDKAHVGRNLTSGQANYIRAYIEQASEQVSPEIRAELAKVGQAGRGTTPEQMLADYALAMAGGKLETGGSPGNIQIPAQLPGFNLR